MVLMSASKSARNQSSIINRGNTCGGVKKSGLSKGIANHYNSSSGLFYSRGVNTTFGQVCGFPTTLRPVQYGRSSYYATHRGG
jgi:hypothetical protein